MIGALPVIGFELIKDYNLYLTTTLIAVSFLVGLIGTMLKIRADFARVEREGHQKDQSRISSAVATTMISYVENYVRKRSFQSALRLGRVLSRPLWLDGQYEERIRLGELMLEASLSAGDKETQTHALIDDMGWTNFILKNYEEAKKNISHGLRIAEETNDFYMVAKAYRHLGGIETKLSRFDEAETNLLAAQNAASKINEEIRRKEMLAGIQYGLADLYMGVKKIDEAEKFCKLAQQTFHEINDRERHAKTFSRLGQILMLKGMDMEALSTFSEGLASSRDVNRDDEIVRNLIGIARIYMKSGRVTDAKLKLGEASDLSDSNGLITERDEARALLAKIK